MPQSQVITPCRFLGATYLLASDKTSKIQGSARQAGCSSTGSTPGDGRAMSNVIPVPSLYYQILFCPCCYSGVLCTDI